MRNKSTQSGVTSQWWYRRNVPTQRAERTPRAPQHGIAEASRAVAQHIRTGWVGVIAFSQSVVEMLTMSRTRVTPPSSSLKAFHA